MLGRDAGGEHRSADKRPPQGASREKVAFGRLSFARQEKSGGRNYGEIDGNNELIQAGQAHSLRLRGTNSHGRQRSNPRAARPLTGRFKFRFLRARQIAFASAVPTPMNTLHNIIPSRRMCVTMCAIDTGFYLTYCRAHA